MYAPRVKFVRIYIVSPIKVAIIFLTSLQCLALLITLLTSFWIETPCDYYGPIFSCKKYLCEKNGTIKCYVGGFIYDTNLLPVPLTAVLIILSLSLSITAIITANLSFGKYRSSVRHQYWLCTTFLLLVIFLINFFILVFVPLSYHHQIYSLKWAYRLHCCGSLFISVCLIAAIFMHKTDDVQYIETIDKSPIEK